MSHSIVPRTPPRPPHPSPPVLRLSAPSITQKLPRRLRVADIVLARTPRSSRAAVNRPPKPRSQIVIIGPFESQVLDLSSSSGSVNSAASSYASLHSPPLPSLPSPQSPPSTPLNIPCPTLEPQRVINRANPHCPQPHVTSSSTPLPLIPIPRPKAGAYANALRKPFRIPSPPLTPTRPSVRPYNLERHQLIDSPEEVTDWVEYSAPMELLEGLSAVEGDSDCSTYGADHSCSSGERSTSDRAFLVSEENEGRKIDRNGEWTKSLLSNLLPNRSPMKPRIPFTSILYPRQTWRLARPPGLDTVVSASSRATPVPPATPISVANMGGFSLITPPATPPDTPPTTPPAPLDSHHMMYPSTGSTLVESDHESETDFTVVQKSRGPEVQIKAEENLFVNDELECDACESSGSRMMHMLPCGNVVCSSCFSSTISAVSVKHGASKCPACAAEVTSFLPCKPQTHVSVRGPGNGVKRVVEETSDEEGVKEHESIWTSEACPRTVVMRIDNVAWDIEPSIVEEFFPPNTLSEDHPQPIHICIDRRDGRTRDYMYIEAASQAAARRVLQSRQNAFMPGGRITGGRKRPVTITQVTHDELLKELRPGSKAELLSLLDLCEAALETVTIAARTDAAGRGRLNSCVSPNGKVHYIKYRYAPFHALMSVMCKLSGPDSPAYWDVFHVASGAIAVLMKTLAPSHSSKDPVVFGTRGRMSEPGDRAVLEKLTDMFDACFGRSSWPTRNV